MTKDPAVYLSHILECIDLVETYIAGMSLGEFEEKQQVQDAVLRRIEIIGEAVKNLPEDRLRCRRFPLESELPHLTAQG